MNNIGPNKRRSGYVTSLLLGIHLNFLNWIGCWVLIYIRTTCALRIEIKNAEIYLHTLNININIFIWAIDYKDK